MEMAFYISSFVAVLATLLVITHKQPIRALLYFIVAILAISCIFFSLGSYFAGAMEIIIYAGAIIVLFVFVVMMFNIDSTLDEQERNYLRLPIWIGPFFLSVILLAILIIALNNADNQNITGERISIKTIGVTLFGPYVLAVELASILLLGGLVIIFHFGQDKKNNAT